MLFPNESQNANYGEIIRRGINAQNPGKQRRKEGETERFEEEEEDEEEEEEEEEKGI